MKLYTRVLSVSILLFMSLFLNAQTRDFTFNNAAQSEGLSIGQDTRSGLTMHHALKHLEISNITDNGYTGDVVQSGTGIILPANAGEPNLPAISRFVAIPNGASAHIEMSHRSMTTIQDVDLLPAAPIKFDTDDSPNTYEKDMSIYGRNAFFPEQPVTVSEPFSLRGVQTVAVTVVPYQYNPVTKELRVYDDIEFSIRFDGGNGEFGNTRLRSPYWDPILMQNLANYNQLPVIDYEARMQDWVSNRPTGCEYLIVIPNNESFRQYANQLRDYRIKQGILTEVKSLSDMGCTSTNQMKDYFHNAYNTWDIPPVAVLLLGDHNTNMAVGIPAETTYHSPSYGNCITDNGYADVTGDLLPEMAFSRLVAANADEAQMMVSKQLEYEYTNPNRDADSYDHPITALGWQTQRWFQICSEAVGGYWRNQGKHPVRINAIYSGTPGDQWSSNQNTYMVVNYFGPNGLGYIPASPSELGGWTGGTAAQVVNAVNSGCMLLQHRDHGYYQGWGEPDFSTSDVAQMNNTGKLTFVNTINCQTGTFDHYTDCLIEAFMRRTYNNQNAGAVGCIGPTQTSYSFVNDAYAWGLYDQYDPQFMPDYGPYANYEGNWRPAFGNVAGKYFLAQSNWPYNTEDKAITYKMFTAHCDAFLTLYTQVPTALSVDHPTQITPNTTSITVTATQGAVIALTRDNNILAVATATGNPQSITFQAQPSNTDITIVATKQDKLRYVGSIHVISEPRLTLTEVTPHDASGNQQLEYGEHSSFDMVIKNVGNLPSALANATLTTRQPFSVTINENTTTIPALSPDEATDLREVFGITVSNEIPNDTQLDFTLTMVSGEHTWTSDFQSIVHAPFLTVSDTMLINDGNNRGNGNRRLDPGENAEIVFSYTNRGGAPANNVKAVLTTESQRYITINNSTITTTTVDAGETVTATYSVNVSATMPRGEVAQFTLRVTAEAYANECSYSHRVGLEVANFENGMGDFEWENDPDHPWEVTTTDPHTGLYCLQSGAIGLNDSSTLSLPFNVENETDEIRFFRKTNCHTRDYLKFYIDGTEIQQWSGTLNWSEMAFPVSQGEHVFTWTYVKGGSGFTGGDHVYIDEILFPVRHISFDCNAGPDQNICKEATQLEGNAIGEESLLWTTSGDGTFSQNDIINPIYTPGEQDLANMSVELNLTATNEAGETLSDNLIIVYHDAVSILMDDEDGTCEDGTYNLSAFLNEASLVNWTTSGDGSFEDPRTVETVYIPGEQDKANGTVTLTLNATSLYGCGDDSHDLVLTIHPLQHTEFDMASCGSYPWNGNEYSEEGDYEQTLESIFGCDSTVVMHLTMVDSYNILTEKVVCDSYEWAGQTLFQSGVYEHLFTSIHGCDSSVVMNLIVGHSSQHEFDAEGCTNYVWNGTTYTESGDYEQILPNAMGCDSLIVLHLTLYTEPVATLNGDDDVDVCHTPTSTYTTEDNSTAILYTWSIEPQEAGSINAENNTATIVWSETYKGVAILRLEASNYCGFTENTMSIAVKNSTDVNEYGIESKVYPNPTNGIVNIEAQGIQRLTVVNTLGQAVYDSEIKADKYQLNMQPFGAGIYLIRLYTTDGISTKRITITK